jgi:hypothetical protein
VSDCRDTHLLVLVLGNIMSAAYVPAGDSSPYYYTTGARPQWQQQEQPGGVVDLLIMKCVLNCLKVTRGSSTVTSSRPTFSWTTTSRLW